MTGNATTSLSQHTPPPWLTSRRITAPSHSQNVLFTRYIIHHGCILHENNTNLLGARIDLESSKRSIRRCRQEVCSHPRRVRSDIPPLPKRFRHVERRCCRFQCCCPARRCRMSVCLSQICWPRRVHPDKRPYNYTNCRKVSIIIQSSNKAKRIGSTAPLH